MNPLKEFFYNKAAREEWAAFIYEVIDREALKRVYKGKETAALKEAREIVARSFKELDELFTEKPKRKPVDRAV